MRVLLQSTHGHEGSVIYTIRIFVTGLGHLLCTSFREPRIRQAHEGLFFLAVFPFFLGGGCFLAGVPINPRSAEKVPEGYS